jgi:hypothetical protein
MSRFRGSDEALEREIAALRGMTRVRLDRANADLRELATALDELRRELRRRRALAPGATDAAESPTVPA